MPAFQYTALDSNGDQVSGQLQASTRSEVYRQLESQFLTPIQVAEQSGHAEKSKEKKLLKSGAKPTLKRAQLIHFTDELADLLDGGLQLDQALRVMHERQESPVLRQIGGSLREQIREGATFSKSLQATSPSFDELYTNMAAAGEVSGSLPKILRQLSANITQLHELQSRVVSAMVYPAFLLGALALLLVVFSTVLVPQLSNMLSKSRQKLPWVTEMLMATSNFIAAWWWLGAILGITGYLAFKGYTATPKGRLWWDQAKLKLPLFGSIMKARFHVEFTSSLSNLVSNGVPLVNALKLCSKATKNLYYRGLLIQSNLLLSEGISLSGALKKVGNFPAMLIDMVALGEQTGRLGHSLDKAATRYDKELNQSIKRLTAMITPIMLIFMFVIVGLVAYAIIASIFQAMTSIKSRG